MDIEKKIKSRITHKHDTEENWLKAVNFTPKNAELIIYDADETYLYPRFKIGDGKTNVNSLPFFEDNKIQYQTVSVTEINISDDLVLTT